MRRSTLLATLIGTQLICSVALATGLKPMQELGKALFFDPSLSHPPGQSCASCHQPEAGWAGPDSAINAAGATYPGAIHERTGNRKPPSAAYAAFSPRFYFDQTEGHFVGGNFWDGRATGWLLGTPTADQAQGPFLNPVEQNNASADTVVALVCKGANAQAFERLFGSDICANPLSAYNAIAQAISAYESSTEVNPFSSKYDYYLKDPKRYPLSEEELLGLELFERADKGNCAACHPNRPSVPGGPALFTDFTYDNLGFPKNPENPWYRMPKEYNAEGPDWVDPGLGGFLRGVPQFAEYADENLGKHRVPTLRNLDLRPGADFVKAFGHNGVLKTMEDVVHFYNTRDVLARCGDQAQPSPGVNCWPPPEVAANVNREELGDLGLSGREEQAIVTFLKTLSDGWAPPSSDEGN